MLNIEINLMLTFLVSLLCYFSKIRDKLFVEQYFCVAPYNGDSVAARARRKRGGGEGRSPHARHLHVRSAPIYFLRLLVS